MVNENEREDIIEEEVSAESHEDSVVEDGSSEVSDLNAVNDEMEELKSTLIRLQADFNNYRNRIDKEKVANIQFAAESLVTKLLSVIDNFDRALESCKDSPSIVEGFGLIKQELLDILGREGLTEIVSTGAEFDPNFHHAVFMEETEAAPGIVLETFQKGYMMKDKVIRPAMVKVSK